MNPSDTLSKHFAELKSRYKIKKLGVFGSYVKGQEQPASDVDILVSFEEPVGIFTFIGLKEFLESILHPP
jgi:predicted nucleotidyltransferase